MNVIRRVISTIIFYILAVCFATLAPAAGQEGEVPQASATQEPQSWAELHAPDGITEIVVGGYINDIHRVDLTTHSYPGDIYIWFRWKNTDMAPHETFEFMNLSDPEAHVEDLLYDEPEPMVDGSLYNIIRHQGAFSAPMPLSKYPFDRQTLKFIVEDAEFGDEVVRYIPDPDGVTINSDFTLPGYIIGKPQMKIYGKTYPTTFGDLNNPETGAYSRVVFEVPIRRPWQYGVFKLFMPVLIVLVCAGLALMIDPTHTEGRIGLVITALLTLVAMQITTSGSLPEVSYLMLLDWVYLISYAFIMIMMARVAYGSWQDSVEETATAIKGDKRILLVTTLVYLLGLTSIIFIGLA